MTLEVLGSALARLSRSGNRGYVLGAIATLGLGIGAVIVIAGLLYALLLAPLGMRDEDRVVHIAERKDGNGVVDFAVASGNLLVWQDLAFSLQSAAAFNSRGVKSSAPATGWCPTSKGRASMACWSPSFYCC